MNGDVIRITCPNCARTLAIPAQYAGQTGACNHCGSPITVPPMEEEDLAGGEQEAGPAIAKLIKILNSPLRSDSAKSDAAEKLEACGQAAVPALQGCLAQRGAAYAASALIGLGHDPFPALFTLATEEKSRHALHALEVLKNSFKKRMARSLLAEKKKYTLLEKLPAYFTPLLFDVMADFSVDVKTRTEALLALSWSSDVFVAWTKKLLADLKDDDYFVREKTKEVMLENTQAIRNAFHLLNHPECAWLSSVSYEYKYLAHFASLCQKMLTALGKPSAPELEQWDCFKVELPEEPAWCSDPSCPCGVVGTRIPRGAGYLYISEQVVEFRRNPQTSLMALAMLRAVEGNSIVVAGPGVTLPILMCEQGARKRGLNLEVAAADAKRWWETGLVPLRPTPKAHKPHGQS